MILWKLEEGPGNSEVERGEIFWGTKVRGNPGASVCNSSTGSHVSRSAMKKMLWNLVLASETHLCPALLLAVSIICFTQAALRWHWASCSGNSIISPFPLSEWTTIKKLQFPPTAQLRLWSSVLWHKFDHPESQVFFIEIREKLYALRYHAHRLLHVVIVCVGPGPL